MKDYEKEIGEKEIGEKIMRIRKSNGFSQERLAEILEIGDRAKLSRIECGKQSMTGNELIRFCNYFKVSLDAMLDDNKLTGDDFLEIADRFIDNDTISDEVKREILKTVHLKFEEKVFNEEIIVLNLNNNSIKPSKSSKFNIDTKLKVDKIWLR